MDDSSIDQELKRKLNFSWCEEESENEGPQEAQGSREAPGQSPDTSEVQASEAKSAPPRTPLRNVHELSPSQEKDRGGPQRSPKCPETPDQPDDGSQLPYCESPFTPKMK